MIAGPVAADLTGQTCVVTGATSGIGRETARGLARLGARVVMAVRDPRRGERTRAEITGEIGDAEVEVATVDLGRQASIRAFARALAERYPKLDVLVNNAGIWSRRRQTSPEGIELVWATNVLGYFLTAELLLPSLRASGRGRVINVASLLARDLDIGDVEFERRRWSGVSAYAQSKQANCMLTWALARRIEGSGVTANALHPGFVSTGIFAKGGGVEGLVVSLLAKLRAKRPAQGADTVIWLAASPEPEGRNGVFWVDRREHACPYRDEVAEEELWRRCQEMILP